MSYSNRGMGAAPKGSYATSTTTTKGTTTTTSASKSSTPVPGAKTTSATPEVALSKSQATAMALGPVQADQAAIDAQKEAARAKAAEINRLYGRNTGSKAESGASIAAAAEATRTKPESLLTAECADYRYVVKFKPLSRTGILPAGTPMVGGVKISWDPSVVGVDFPKSWLTERNSSADSERLKLDDEMRRARPSAPATSSAFLTTAAKVFLLGIVPQGQNSAVLVAGAVSTRDVDVDSMMSFLKRLLLTQKRVEGGGFGLMAFATVPKLAPGQAASAPVSGDYARYKERIPGYSIDDAAAMALAAALSKREALQVMVSGEIFGGLAVASSKDLFLDGEAAVKAAIESVAKASTLAELTTGITGLTSGAVAEAEAAKSLPQEEGDAACAAILDRLAAARDSINTAMSAELAKLAAGPAALASAQQAVAKFTATAHGAEEEIRRIVAERIAAWEAKPSFKSLTPEEQFAVRCIMQNKAAPLVARRTDTAATRFAAITAIKPDEFAASTAAATQAYTAAQATATAAINDAIAKVEEIRRVIGLPFYMKSFYGLPVWAWGAGGAALLIGGAVYVRSRRKKAAASSGQK